MTESGEVQIAIALEKMADAIKRLSSAVESLSYNVKMARWASK